MNGWFYQVAISTKANTNIKVGLEIILIKTLLICSISIVNIFIEK